MIVHHPKVLSAPIVADAIGVPHILAELVPSVTPTSAFPAAGTVNRGPRFVNRLTYRAAGAASAMFRSELAEVRAMVGARRGRPSVPAATLVPISPVILPRPDDWPESAHLTGPWIREDRAVVLDQDLAGFIAGRPFLYAGFGSMAAAGAASRGRAIVDAARARGIRTLIATGLGGIDVPADSMGDDVLVVRTVPHARVLPRASIAVHHGGIGTLHAATRAGTPSVVVSSIADQPFWGARLWEAGLAPAPIRRRALTAASLGNALDQADRCRPRVGEAARAMAAKDGTGAALSVVTAVSST